MGGNFSSRQLYLRCLISDVSMNTSVSHSFAYSFLFVFRSVLSVSPLLAQHFRSEESPLHRELLLLIVEVPLLQALRQFLL